MNSTIPADLLELEARFETWRTNRKYLREPIPDELWNAAADLSRRYPPSLVSRVLKIDPSRLKKFQLKRSARTSNRKKPHFRRQTLGRLLYCQRSPRRLWVHQSRARNKPGRVGDLVAGLELCHGRQASRRRIFSALQLRGGI